MRLWFVMIFMAGAAFAHDGQQGEHDTSQARLMLAALEKTRVSIAQKDGYLIIQSNGIPNHTTGQFPNRNNPHAISAQQHSYRVTASPKPSGRMTEMRVQPFGVALNGVPFDPGTAECYGQPRGGRPGSACEWRQEAIVRGKGTLGLDGSNAHVQPNGAYHYHGIPHGLVASSGGSGDLVHVGYAADGFKMVVSRSGAYTPSYILKSGTRPDGPGGRYDGTYTEDYEYISGLGNLDQCNGTVINGEYMYVLTDAFPNIPRCWVGTPNQSFARHTAGGQSGQSGGRGMMHPPRGEHPPRGPRPFGPF